ncbi:MAG: HAAS signaling domain-containing protein [Candidatus Kariarchaeaceae archaeon]|jgi:hypothetical protein
MMSKNIYTTDDFTEEAVKTLNKYLKEVKSSLKATELKPDEIEESINDLKSHIIQYCLFKGEHDEIITTDLVKAAIHKLGDPEVIGETLQNELEFSEITSPFRVTDEEIVSDRRQDSSESRFTLNITVNSIVILYQIVNWLFTGLVIFLIFGIQGVEVLMLMAYILSFMLLLTTRSLSSYSTNKYLSDNVSINTHLVLVPLIYFGIIIFNIANRTIDIIMPTIFVMWIYVIVSPYGKEYLEKLYKSIITYQTSID